MDAATSDGRSDLLRQGFRAGNGRFRQQHGEFLASDSRRDVASLDVRVDHLRNGADDLIPSRCP